jgi:hypothetical protein
MQQRAIKECHTGKARVAFSALFIVEHEYIALAVNTSDIKKPRRLARAP